MHTYPVEMAQNFWAADLGLDRLFSGHDGGLPLDPAQQDRRRTRGLVYSLTPKIKEQGVPWFKQPAFLGGIVLVATLILNLIFW